MLPVQTASPSEPSLWYQTSHQRWKWPPLPQLWNGVRLQNQLTISTSPVSGNNLCQQTYRLLCIVPLLESIPSISAMTKMAPTVSGLPKWANLIKIISNHKKLIRIWWCSLECQKLVPLHLLIKVQHKFQKLSTWMMLITSIRSINWKRSDCH